jgi:hypothetical protein
MNSFGIVMMRMLGIGENICFTRELQVLVTRGGKYNELSKEQIAKV